MSGTTSKRRNVLAPGSVLSSSYVKAMPTSSPKKTKTVESVPSWISQLRESWADNGADDSEGAESVLDVCSGDSTVAKAPTESKEEWLYVGEDAEVEEPTKSGFFGRFRHKRRLKRKVC
jgi:hypothetical protein